MSKKFYEIDREGTFSKTFFFITDVTDKQVRVYGPQRPFTLSM